MKKIKTKNILLIFSEIISVLMLGGFFMGAVISMLMIWKYVNEILSLSYISNINMFKYLIKISGFGIFGFYSAQLGNYYVNNDFFPKLKAMKYRLNNKTQIFFLILAISISIIIGLIVYYFLKYIV